MNRREGQRSRILRTLLCFFVLLFCVNASGVETAFAAETGGLFTETVTESDSNSLFVKVTSGSASGESFTEVMSVSGSENLSVLHADFLTEGQYNDAQKLGDNLLLIRLYVPESAEAVATIEADGEVLSYEENFGYQFDLYSPEENAIVAALNTESLSADYYQIIGSELLLINYEEKLVYRFDEMLSYQAVYDVSSFLDHSDGFFYPASEGNTWYFYNYEENSIQKAVWTVKKSIEGNEQETDRGADQKNEEEAEGKAVGEEVVEEAVVGTESVCTISDTGLADYCAVIHMVSPDAQKLLLSVVDRQTFLSKYLIADTADLSTVYEYPGESFYYGILSDQAFLACCSQDADALVSEWIDQDTEIMMCDWFDGEKVYFAAPEGCSVSLMGGYLLVVRDTLFAGEGEEPAYSAAVYDQSGSCVSAMRLAGDTDQGGEGDIYFLSELLYFEEANCVAALMGDVDGDVFLVFWDLSIPGESAENLVFYTPVLNSKSDSDFMSDLSSETDSQEKELEEADSEEAAPETILVIGDETGGELGEDPAQGPKQDKDPEQEQIFIIGEELDETEAPAREASDDSDSYDWGSLQDVRSRADALEEKYGISIYLGEQLPSQIGEYYLEPCLDEESLCGAMDKLELILSLYPESFFQQLLYDDLRGIRIYLAGTLWGDTEGMLDQAGAYVTEIGQYRVMVLDAEQYWNWDYMLNHEISHMIDRSLAFRSIYQKDALFSEETWASYNPSGFDYLYTYDRYEDNEAWYLWPDAFIDAYGTTYATEDRAEIFGTVMSEYMNQGSLVSRFTEGSVLMEKLRYYCACIRAGFDTTGWSETMPWELY